MDIAVIDLLLIGQNKGSLTVFVFCALTYKSMHAKYKKRMHYETRNNYVNIKSITGNRLWVIIIVITLVVVVVVEVVCN